MDIIHIALEHREVAPLILLGALLLIGFYVPISEDIIFIVAGFLASRHQENKFVFYFIVLLGAYGSDWIGYWMGRLLGGRLARLAWFKRLISPQQVKHIQTYFRHHGVLTIIFGRFLPYGFRNALYFTTGLGRMPLLKFALVDLIPCLAAATTWFAIAYTLGNRYELLLTFIKLHVRIGIPLVLGAIAAVIGWCWYKQKKNR